MRSELNAANKSVASLGFAPAGEIDGAEELAGFDVVGIALEDGCSLLLSLIKLARGKIEAAEGEAGLDEIGIELHGTLEGFEGILPMGGCNGGFRELEVGVGKAWIDFEGVAELNLSLLILTLLQKLLSTSQILALCNVRISSASSGEQERDDEESKYQASSQEASNGK
jgi:hypothetical protein